MNLLWTYLNATNNNKINITITLRKQLHNINKQSQNNIRPRKHNKRTQNKINMNNKLSTLNAEIVGLIFSATYCLLYAHYP
jgi:hypothetical protein